MNNNAKKIKTPEEYFTKEYPHPSPGTYHGWFKFAEAYHQFAREKELSALTDEVIEGMVNRLFIQTPDKNSDMFNRMWMKEGAKALRNHLKQNK